MPFHIAVKAEQLTQIIHAQIGRIPSAAGDAFPLFSVRVDHEHRSLSLEEQGRIRFGNMASVLISGAVAAHEIEIAVESTQEGMGIVIAAGPEFISEAATM